MSRIENDLKFIWEIIYQFYKVRRKFDVTKIVKKYGMDHEDVFQVASLAYIRAEEKFDNSSGVKLHTFIGHCIKNDLAKINQHQKLKKRDTSKLNFLPIDAETKEGRPFAEMIPGEDNTFEDIDNELTIKRFLKVLSDGERRCVIGVYLHCKSQHEIAKELGIGQITVSRRTKTALSKMQAVANG